MTDSKKDEKVDETAPAPTTPPLGRSEPVVVDARPLVPQNQAEKTLPFRLKAGAQHLHAGVGLKAGQVAHLTASQAEAFADKFDPVDATSDDAIDPDDINSEDEVTRLRAENAQLRARAAGVVPAIPDPNSGIRQDVGANTPMGKETVLSGFDGKLPESGVADKAKVTGGDESLQPAGSVPSTPVAGGASAGGAPPKGGSTDTSGAPAGAAVTGPTVAKEETKK